MRLKNAFEPMSLVSSAMKSPSVISKDTIQPDYETQSLVFQMTKYDCNLVAVIRIAFIEHNNTSVSFSPNRSSADVFLKLLS